jgi:putative transposase
MPRQPRFFVAGQVLHVIQRGNNRMGIFRDPADHAYFLSCLQDAAERHGVCIHAYVLMTNHVHLLASPADASSLPKALQSVGRRYVYRFNSLYDRTGTLWEGRYRACIVDSERYLLTCMRYIELNPVRAGLCRQPDLYRWSSHAANVGGVSDPLVTPHELYERLGDTSEARRAAYKALFGSEIAPQDLDAIRKAAHANWALGSTTFQRGVESTSGRRAAPVKNGRPLRGVREKGV